MATVSSNTSVQPHAEKTSPVWVGAFSSGWVLAAILLFSLAAYAPMLDDWFSGDDFWFLRGAQSTSFGDYALKSFDFRETSNDYEFNRYRPLYPIAWKIQYELFGLHAFYYHAVLVGLHLTCVVLAWFVFRRLLGEDWLSNLATLIFALHPAYVDAVGWLSGGNRVFAGAPYIAALLLFMKHRDPMERHRTLCYAACVLMYVAAMLMHSSTITLVAVLPLYVFLVAGQPRDALRWRAWVFIVPFALCAAGVWGIQLWVRGHIGAGGFSLGTHVFSNYGWYYGMLAVPVQTLVATSRIESIAERLQLVAGFALIALAFAVAYRRPMWGLGIFASSWFFLALLPDSTFILGQAGRLMYVPGFAGALLLAVIAVYVRDILPEGMRRRVIAVAPYVLVLAIVPATLYTYVRTRGLTDNADRYEDYATALQREGPVVGTGDTLYLVGIPQQGLLLPDSHMATLVQLYYGDVDVVVVRDQSVPQLESGDAVFTYTP